MPLTDLEANTLLDSRFGGQDPHVPATWWVGLSTTDPGQSGTAATEPSGGGYAPVPVPNDAAHWHPATGRAKQNGLPITFPTASAAWGALGWYVLKDAAAGTVRAYGRLQSVKTVTAGATPSLAAGALVVTSPPA